MITIGELTDDLIPFTEEGNKAATIAIVPRKIVEDIIAECERVIGNLHYKEELNVLNDYEMGKVIVADTIRTKAETMLNEFEGVSK